MKGWWHALVRGPAGPALLASAVVTFVAVQGSSGPRDAVAPLIYESGGALSSEESENITARIVGSYESASVHHLRVARAVRAHYHAGHDETVIVLSGEGSMTVGEETRVIRAGTVLLMPRGTVHSLEVTGEPIEAISVFSPEFDGEDRIFVDPVEAGS